MKIKLQTKCICRFYKFLFSTVTDYEGNTYLAAQFGSAGCWMTQNLRSTKRSATEILVEDKNVNKENVAYYYYPNADPDILTDHPEYGLLYTWAAASYGADPDEEFNAFPEMASTLANTSAYVFVVNYVEDAGYFSSGSKGILRSVRCKKN